MRKITICLMILFAFTAPQTFAASGHDDHSGHDHTVELRQSKVKEKASGFVAKIVGKGKLDASWSEVKPQEPKENSKHEWVVVFLNPHIKDSEKRTLYMFLTLSGEYIAANFSGK
jgi:hypothetical protein